MGLLNDTEINNKLTGLNGWEKAGNEIVKSFKFANFIASIGFVNRIAILSEKADHHPDILIQYSNVKITLSTHSDGGLTEKDFNLAGEREGAFNS